MNALKCIGCVLLALLLIGIVIGVYAFFYIIVMAIAAIVVIGMTAYGIRAYFKGRPRKS